MGDAAVEEDAAMSDASPEEDSGSSETVTYRGEVWADNWSSMYIGETLVMEDSVPITTERSFNSETFTFEASRPFQVNVVLKDFIENDSGLEYIGSARQQMGDGGYIAQITDTDSGERVLLSSADWRCLTIHEAPLNVECEDDANPEETCEATISEEPAGWRAMDFDDSSWPMASVFSAAAVDPKQGYDDITWDPDAEFIWGANLQTHNTVLCRITVE